MSRPRAFADDAVLDAATACFWQHGYAATSVRDLGAAMGLVPASLYNAFGNKQALFERCLERYLDGAMRARIARLESTAAPRAAVETFLNDIVTRALADPRGCLLVNTAVEVAPHDPQVGAAVAASLGELEAFFCRAVEAGQSDGTITAGRDARDLARLFVATILGLRVLSRTAPDPALLRGIARQALALLDPNPALEAAA